jgi:predicted  nucleic acid-binding Zn-ribbon protein
MSLALRIFIVLTLVMTLAFMFIQMTLFATRENWKRRWDSETKALAAELKSATQALTSESAGRVRAENQVAALQNDRVADQAKLKELEGQITERAAKIQNLDRDLAKAQTDFNALKEDYQTQSKSLDMVRQRNGELTNIASVARAVAFNLNVKLAEVEDDLNNLQTEHTRSLENLEKTIAERKQADAFVSQVREKFPKVYEALADGQGTTAVLRATVAAVRPNNQGQQEFVMLSIGKEESVQEGQEFIIYRENKYICKVRVEKIMNDMAPARVIPSSWNTNGLTIQQGDQAANRL